MSVPLSVWHINGCFRGRESENSEQTNTQKERERERGRRQREGEREISNSDCINKANSITSKAGMHFRARAKIWLPQVGKQVIAVMTASGYTA